MDDKLNDIPIHDEETLPFEDAVAADADEIDAVRGGLSGSSSLASPPLSLAEPA
jgi:hypothetical protein